MKLAVKDVLDNGQTGGLSYACLLTAKHYAVELAACTAQKEGLEYGACRPADDVDRERTRDENDEFRERGGLTYPRDRDDGSTERRDNVALRAVGGDAPGPEEAEVRWADLPPLAPDEVALYIRQDGTSKLELILRHNGA
jgi:hypothetical protein